MMKDRCIDCSLRSQYVLYLWVLVVIDLTFPIFNYIPIFQRHYLFWLLSMILAFCYAKKYFLTKMYSFMMIYGLMLLLNQMYGDFYFNDKMVVFGEILNLFIPTTMFYYVIKNVKRSVINIFLFVFGVFLIESTIVSYYANSMFPNLMRLQSNALSIEMNKSILLPFQMLGMSNYDMPHAIPVIIPGIIYMIFTTRKLYKLFFVIVLFSAWILTYVSGSFTAMIFATFSVLASLLVHRNNSKKTLKRILFLSLLLLSLMASKPFLIDILQNVQQMFPHDSIAYAKIADIENSLLYNEADGGVEARKVLYETTWKAIGENFILGTNEEVGGHSSILDRFATLGFLGFLPLILFVCFQIKYTFSYISSANRYYYVIGLFCAVLMMATKSACNWSMWFFLLCLLPSMLFENVESSLHIRNK